MFVPNPEASREEAEICLWRNQHGPTRDTASQAEKERRSYCLNNMEEQGCRYRIQSKPLCNVCAHAQLCFCLARTWNKSGKNVCLGMAFPMEHNVLQHNIRCILLCIGKHYISIFCETCTRLLPSLTLRRTTNRDRFRWNITAVKCSTIFGYGPDINPVKRSLTIRLWLARFAPWTEQHHFKITLLM